MSKNNIKLCIQELEKLCATVALTRCDDQVRFPGVDRLPSDVVLWSGSYAKLLLWPVKSVTIDEILLAVELGEGWLDAALTETERRSKIHLDGYLVLALPSAPDPSAKKLVRKFELSSRLCRKHFVWPEAVDDSAASAERWLRIADVTVLGLPEAVTAAGETPYWPEMGDEAEGLWRDLQKNGPAKQAQSDSEIPIPGEHRTT